MKCVNNKLECELLEFARTYAINAHKYQKYGDNPYIYHLDSVVAILSNYSLETKIVGYLHDIIEDTKITKKDLEKEFGSFLAKCVSLISDEPGKSRKEQKIKTNKKLSKITNEFKLVLIVKAADRLANVLSSIEFKLPHLFNMYKKEYSEFTKAVYRKELCDDIWDQLSSLLIFCNIIKY